MDRIGEERFREEDLISRVYECFLQVYAVSVSKEDGEFYTSVGVVKTDCRDDRILQRYCI